MGGFGACALARKNFERKTELDAVVHFLGENPRSDDGKRRCMRTKSESTPPAMYKIRERGDALL